MKKELSKRIMIGLLSGISISFIITILISLVAGDGNYYACVPSFIERFDNEINAVVIQTLLSAVLGAAFAGSSIIWELDDWSLLKQTGIYFAIITIAMMSVAYICEWMEHSVKGVVGYFCIFFGIFVVIWIVRYIFWKIQVSNIKSKIDEDNK